LMPISATMKHGWPGPTSRLPIFTVLMESSYGHSGIAQD
jgi:hypothetical protein